MKQSWQCTKCRGRRVGYLGTVADSGPRGLHSRKIGEAVSGAVLGMRVLKSAGEIEAFVCTDCGYFEEYVKDPGSIDWNSMNGFRWCRPEVAGPSRG
jgi:predicted nucleic-acid-binding Zn-ribbon protein